MRQCLEHEFKFYGLYRGNELQEAAFLNLNKEEGQAEIIDFVTPTALKGKNCSYHLLSDIKQEIKAKGLKTLYSSIRGTYYGLNITFDSRVSDMEETW